MYARLLLCSLFASSLAAPLAKQDGSQRQTWEPATGSKTTCDKQSDKIMGFYAGPQMDTVINDACAAMMPGCAYQERLDPDIMCIQTVTWPLKGPVRSVQSANVETSEGNKISGWDVEFSVTPAPQPADSAGVFWTKKDCYGYFAHMLEKWEPEGCHTNKGFGVGKITVGGEDTLKDTVFEVTIVPEK
ncbi:hypothetical protein BKA63DRAFT_529659 [Paraphoma chrysanthemicola]|nr:hypothetical protein BKA63DRAFT_529659 [Paraphoma chrysanthemicola]